MLYRAMGEEVIRSGKKLRLSTIGKVTSDDGEVFSERTQFIAPQNQWEMFGCEDPRVTFIDGTYYIF